MTPQARVAVRTALLVSLATSFFSGTAPGAVATPTTPATPALPTTPRRPAEDSFHGQIVREEYRWLEDWSSPEVRDWSDAQNAVTRAFLDAIPERPTIFKRVTQLTQSISPLYYGLEFRGRALFALKDQPPRQQALLVRLASANDTTSEKVLVDPNALDPSGGTSIDFFAPSPDGSKVAVSMSKHGTEDGTVYVYDARTGARLDDEVPRVNGGTAGGSVAWNADGTGFWRTRYPSPGERPEEDLEFYQQVYFHRLGTPASEDSYVLGREFPKIAEIVLRADDDGRHVLVNVFNGDGGEHGFWLAGPDGRFREITRFADQVVNAAFGTDALYMLSRKDAPNGKILRLTLADALADGPALEHARVLVPEAKTAIVGFVPTETRLYVEDIVGGPSAVRVFDRHTGKLIEQVPIPPVSSVGGLVKTTGDEILIETESFTDPDRWWRYDDRSTKLEPTALVLHSPADYSDTEVRREFAVSRDGTRVPVNILFKKGTRFDGSAPCILYGYGGYGISQRPTFSASRRLWIEQGGIFVVANIRGGGEYGDSWHRAGNLIKKQNVFDDFAACAQYLIDRKYTRRDKLAIQGGSNGGLLMGAMITQHPELFRACVSSVGVYDMLRVELSPNGLFNVTEYGTVKDPEQFKALYGYSPYHHIVEGTRYPAILMTTGANDPRVEPWHSRKMIARLQAASTSGEPILLRTSASTGHGGGTPLTLRNEQIADVYTFLFKLLGVPYREVAKPLP